MTPIKKYSSETGFTYEKNNFASFVNTGVVGGDYHKMMEFIKRSKLSYAMTATPVIYEEVVEQMWSSAEFNSIDETISFTLKNNTYVVNADLVKSCFKIPDDTVNCLPSDS